MRTRSVSIRPFSGLDVFIENILGGESTSRSKDAVRKLRLTSEDVPEPEMLSSRRMRTASLGPVRSR